MRTFSTFPIMLLALLLVSCANNPPQKDTIQSPAEVLQKMQELQVEKQQQQQPTTKTLEVKSIVPSINEQGQRGKIARRMMENATALFLKADINRDNLISVEEAGQFFPHVSQDFSRYDKNQDNGVSWQELLGHDKWPAPVHGNVKP